MRSSENQADHFDVCAFEDNYPKDVVLHYYGLEMIDLFFWRSSCSAIIHWMV